MEQLNSVILRGIIGNARIQNIGETQMARFSLATNYAFKSRSGEAINGNIDKIFCKSGKEVKKNPPYICNRETEKHSIWQRP